MLSLKRVNKSLRKRARRASEVLYDIVGLSPRKELFRALLAGDEEKCIRIYVSVSNGKSLEEDMYPSLPLLDSDLQTPLHLAALKGMDTLIEMFISHGGNPNTLNGNNETSLHSVCQEPTGDQRKRNIMLVLLEWQEKGTASTLLVTDEDDVVGASAGGGDSERVSVNRVDSDGNTACHYAAAAGLAACVLELVRRGCIVSIVNKDQMTCCEMADEGGYSELAAALELALVYQPTDSSTLYLSQGGEFSHEADQPAYLPDATSFTLQSLRVWRELQVQTAHDALVTHSHSQIETLLDCFDWNINELVFKYMSDPIATLEAARLPGPGDMKVRGDVCVKEQGDSDDDQILCSICAEPLLPALLPSELMALDYGDREQRRVDCGEEHSFCFSCWATYLKLQVVENSLTALTCPGYQCTAALNTSAWAECLLGDYVDRFKDNTCRRVVEASDEFCFCPAKDCDLIIYVDNEKRRASPSVSTGATIATASSPLTATCGHGHSVCLSCRDVGHAPCSCEDYSLWKSKISKEISDSAALNTNEVATALWVQANTKKCPKCKTPIEKDEGCNHMTCKKCRYDFCWICMQRWENHSNRTGGYFQCNMYAAADLEHGGDSRDSEDWGETGLFSEHFSAGSSTKETLRLRKNAAIMDRFIQHYSSFKAHEDSVQLEVKMQFDTLGRISASLQRSVSRELQWLRGEEVSHPLVRPAQEGNEKESEEFSTKSEEFSWRGDVDTEESTGANADSYPLLFLQKGFRELIKCRQFLKGFFAFSFYMLTDDHIRKRGSSSHFSSSQRVLVESRKESIERARSDLETLTETLSNIVARKRLRASRSEIERATRAARSQRLEFEMIISSFVKSCESNDKSFKKSHVHSHRHKKKGKGRATGDTSGDRHARHGIEALNSLGEMSLFDNIEYLRFLVDDGGDNYDDHRERRGRNMHGGSHNTSVRERDSQISRELNPEQFSLQPGQALLHGSVDVADIDGIDLLGLNDTGHNSTPLEHIGLRDGAASKGVDGTRSRSSSSSSSTSSSAASVNIRQIGNNSTRSFPVSSRVSNHSTTMASLGRDKSDSDRNDLDLDVVDDSRHSREDFGELQSNSEELEMNRAILLSLQNPLSRHITADGNATSEPSEEDVQSLVAMGFERDKCSSALKDCSNNVEDAVLHLLSLS
mmetsp:Transcript_19069/g.31890  ORF Transcript_19069/g.31890 Transcript_19069/m.31890 type:complete len:1165 (+) Transcript_19069:214-3708(+)